MMPSSGSSNMSSSAAAMKKGNKMMMVVTNCNKMGQRETGWYLPEAAHPMEVFMKSGMEVMVCSPKGGMAPMDPHSAEKFGDDPICRKFMSDESIQAKFRNTCKISDMMTKLDEFCGMFVVGGHGPMFDMPDCADLQKCIMMMHDKGMMIGAICHGPSAFVNVRMSNGDFLVKGKQMTCLSNAEEELMGQEITKCLPFMLETKLKERGCIYSCAPPKKSHVVRCERLFTGQNPASAASLAEMMMQEMKSMHMA